MTVEGLRPAALGRGLEDGGSCFRGRGACQGGGRGAERFCERRQVCDAHHRRAPGHRAHPPIADSYPNRHPLGAVFRQVRAHRGAPSRHWVDPGVRARRRKRQACPRGASRLCAGELFEIGQALVLCSAKNRTLSRAARLEQRCWRTGTSPRATTGGGLRFGASCVGVCSCVRHGGGVQGFRTDRRPAVVRSWALGDCELLGRVWWPGDRGGRSRVGIVLS
jgi:hypothetical protein